MPDLDFPDAPARGAFSHSRLWDGDKWTDEENHWVLAGYPVGAMVDMSRAEVPRYWLPADHREVSRTTYAALFAKYGTRYGDGDGSTTFNLPDTRARATIGALEVVYIGRGSGDERVGAHSHPLIDYGHNHGLADPTHQHLMWQNAHAHSVPDPGHGHGIGQSPHDHGVGDPGHNHGIADPTHGHADQGHTWGHVVLGHEGGEFDCAAINEANQLVHDNWTGIWNDANWTGIGWHGATAWIGMNGAYTGTWIDANNANIPSYTTVGVSLTVNSNTVGWVTFSTVGDGVAGNIQPSLIVTKMIYAGVV